MSSSGEASERNHLGIRRAVTNLANRVTCYARSKHGRVRPVPPLLSPLTLSICTRTKVWAEGVKTKVINRGITLGTSGRAGFMGHLVEGEGSISPCSRIRPGTVGATPPPRSTVRGFRERSKP